MQKTIDNKLNPATCQGSAYAIGNQNITARRSRIVSGMREEVEGLAQDLEHHASYLQS